MSDRLDDLEKRLKILENEADIARQEREGVHQRLVVVHGRLAAFEARAARAAPVPTAHERLGVELSPPAQAPAVGEPSLWARVTDLEDRDTKMRDGMHDALNDLSMRLAALERAREPPPPAAEVRCRDCGETYTTREAHALAASQRAAAGAGAGGP